MRPPKLFTALLLAAVVSVLSVPLAFAVTGQTHLDPSTLTKYLDPLPVPAKLDGTVSQTITMSEFTQQVLPSLRRLDT